MRAVTAEELPEWSRVTHPSPQIAAAATELLQVQRAGDQAAAMTMGARWMLGGMQLRDVLEAVRIVQVEIGRLWEHNLISVADEHVATAIAQLVLAGAFSRAPFGERRDQRIVVACVEGERHELPARLLADLLALEGFEVRFVGADVPLHDLRRLILETAPAAIALSVTMTHHLDALRATVAALRDAAPHVPILAGGHAIAWSPRLGSELGIETLDPACDAADVMAAFDRALGNGGPA